MRVGRSYVQRHHLRWMLFAVLVVLHLWLGLDRDRPIFFADEAGYIGHARMLAGREHMGITKYHPGYSFFIAPAFWLFDDPAVQYRAVVAINALLLSSLLLPLEALVERLRPLEGAGSLLVAFVACLYPSFLLQGNMALAENAFIPAVVVQFWLVARALEARSLGWFAGAGALAGTLYLVHPRALGFVPVALLGAAWMAWAGWRRLYAAVLAGSAVGAFLTARAIRGAMVSAGGGDGSGYSSAWARIGRLFGDPAFQIDVLLNAVGHLWYLGVATLGVALVGLGLVVARALRDRTGPSGVLAGWILLAAGSVFALSIVYMADGRRGDLLYYGRYNEAVLAPFLAVGLGHLARRFEGRGLAAGLVVALGGAGVVLHLGRGAEVASQVNLVNVLAFAPLVRWLGGHVDAGLFSLVACVGAAVLVGVARWSRTGVVALLAGWFLVSARHTDTTWFAHMQAGQERNQLAWMAARIQDLWGPDAVSYDHSFYRSSRYYPLRYQLPDVAFERFRSTAGEQPSRPVVVGSTRWQDARALKAIPYAVGQRGEPVIWALPEAQETPPGRIAAWRASDLPTRIGRKNAERGTLRSRQHETGYLQFGPYVNLPAGRYEARWIGRIHRGGWVAAGAAGDKGRARFGGREATVEKSRRVGPVITVHFEVPEPSTGVELRLKVGGDVDMTLALLELYWKGPARPAP